MRLVGTGVLLVLLAGLVAASAAAGATAPPPEFTLASTGGKTVSLSSFLGRKPVLLAFWATWCPHCNEAVPALNRMHSRLEQKLQILAVDFMESREKVGAFVKAKKVAYPVLYDSNGNVARAYKVLGIPTYILIGRSGTVLYSGNELPRDIDRLLD